MPQKFNPIPELSQKQIDLFWSKVDKGADDECWPWTGCIIANGYGQFSPVVDGVEHRVTAHRLALFLTNGDWPDDKPYCCHAPIICHNRACCNPGHLYWGTCRDNHDDRCLDKTQHLGTKNPKSKLNEDKVREIRRLINKKQSLLSIAKKYGVSWQSIKDIKTGKNWNWLD